MQYACIQAHRDAFPLSRMCAVLGVSRSGFYAARQRGPNQHEHADQRLRVEIRAIHRASKRRYGSPRVHEALKAQGIRCGRKRVARLMREDGLQAKRRTRFRTTTNAAPTYPVADNLLARRFAVEKIEGVDQVWIGDITYVPTREGWLYVAVVRDVARRLGVGWAMQNTLAASRATDALTMARWRCRPSAELLQHSDRGVPYAAAAYQARLAEHGSTWSRRRKGNWWHNAVAESFFATLAWELIDERDWHTHQEAKGALVAYGESWCQSAAPARNTGLQTSCRVRGPTRPRLEGSLTPMSVTAGQVHANVWPSK